MPIIVKNYYKTVDFVIGLKTIPVKDERGCPGKAIKPCAIWFLHM
ncbi:hypothetical protein [Metabacillus arenae]|nr:hypothetical protein [Metabacillus arenae]